MNPETRFKLEKLTLSGFKSIASQNDAQSIEFSNINIILGANGSGKSNLISFFKMLNMITTGALQEFVGKQGTARTILHYGPKVTAKIQANLHFASDLATDEYCFTLAHAANDTLIFTDEKLSWHQREKPEPFKIDLGAGHMESRLYEQSRRPNAKSARVIYQMLRSCQVFQFHDTSETAMIRSNSHISNDRFLYSDAGNLATYLYSLRENSQFRRYYERIERRIQNVLPQFGNFELEPTTLNPDYIALNWREKHEQEYLFGARQLSDGSLRFMALATLLLQPPEKLPSVIVIDEPELGLHPAAISILAGMIKLASQHCQIIMATQSTRLVDEFHIDDIIIVERKTPENRSIFKRLNRAELKEWLEAYSVSELWEKNVLGGKP